MQAQTGSDSTYPNSQQGQSGVYGTDSTGQTGDYGQQPQDSTGYPNSQYYPNSQNDQRYSQQVPGADVQTTGQPGMRDNGGPNLQNSIQNPRQRNVQPTDIQSLRQQLLQRKPSPPTEYQRMIQESTGQLLPIYGAEVFQEPPSTFAPVDNIPVTPDYVIGPQDELRIQIWGQVSLRGSYIVDRTGAISLPQVGTVHVAGLRFSQLTDFLKGQVGRVYRNFDLNVNLGQLRSIQVFVAGKAKKPGSFTIGSLSTLLNALFASGGVLPQGSFRDIQVKRDGQTIIHFDLYDLLLHGDKSKDIPLSSGDVIFIPDVGPQVAVLGSVKAPAIYELRDEKTFQEVVALAGGATNVAAGTKARIERIRDHSDRDVIEVDLKGNDLPTVRDGDVVILNSIVDRFKDTVTLRGNVANPGRFAWHAGMRVADLIPNRESLVTRDYYRRQNVLGRVPDEYGMPQQQRQNGAPNQTPLLLSGEPGSGIWDNNDIQLPSVSQGDLGLSSALAANRQSQQAELRGIAGGSGGGNSVGMALITGNNSFRPKNDVTPNAPDIDWDYAVIERQSSDTLTTSLVSFSLGKLVLDKDQSQNMELLSGDVVTIFSKADIRVPSKFQTKFVKLEGEFTAAGTYSVKPGETLRQLLARVGGFTPDAYLYASEFTRDSVRRLQKQRLVEYADSLESSISAQTSAAMASALTDRDATAAQSSASEARASLARLRQSQPTGRIVLQLVPDSQGISAVPDLELEDGDRFVVPKIPTTINVVGQVYSANAFVFEPNKLVRDYFRLAGGPDRMADPKREFILRADGSVISRQYASSRQVGNFDHLKMLPGDTIIVPPKIIRGSAMRDLANIAQILQGFGIAAAAIQVLK